MFLIFSMSPLIFNLNPKHCELLLLLLLLLLLFALIKNNSHVLLWPIFWYVFHFPLDVYHRSVWYSDTVSLKYHCTVKVVSLNIDCTLKKLLWQAVCMKGPYLVAFSSCWFILFYCTIIFSIVGAQKCFKIMVLCAFSIGCSCLAVPFILFGNLWELCR